MSLDVVDAVGSGVLDAGRIVEAARSVLRLGAREFDESKINRDKGKFSSKPGGSAKPKGAGKTVALPELRVSIEFVDSHPKIKVAKPTRSFSNFKDAEVWAKQNVSGTHINAATSMRIQVGSRAIAKVLSGSAAGKGDASVQQHIDAISALPSIIENSILYETHADRKGDLNIAGIHRLVAPVYSGGQVFATKLTIKELSRQEEGIRFYSYQLDSLEVAASELSHAPGNQQKSDPQAATTVSLRELLANFKFNDGTPVIPSDAQRLSAEQPRKADDIERYRLMAEILVHVYGEDIPLATMMAFNPIDHPRDGKGRFCKKGAGVYNSAKNKIKESLSGPKTTKAMGALAQTLSTLSIAQLNQLVKRLHLESTIRPRDRQPEAETENKDA